MRNEIPKEVKLEYKPCPISENGTEDEFVLQGTDKLHNLPGVFTVVKSKESGLLRTNPRPTPETIGFYYPDDYGPYEGTKVIAKVNKGQLKRIINSIFRFDTEKIPNLKPGKMLEIGCASGAFMHRMALKGWEVEGIEYSAKAAKNAQSLGYTVHVGALETTSLPEKSYDLVVGWMVLEHLHDPVLSLKKLHQWTKQDARLILSVPNAASFEFKFFKDCWYALQVPTHLYHYTPKSLEKVLDKSGWELEKVYHQRILTNLFVSFGLKLESLGYNNGASNFFKHFSKQSKYLQYILYPLAFVLAMFGNTGRMTIWAKKKLNNG